MPEDRAERLRQRIEEMVRSRLDVLEQEISRLQREVHESFTGLLERSYQITSVDEADEELSRITAEVGAQIDSASATGVRLGADIALLRDSVAELEQQRTQAEVLNCLVSRTSNFAPRVALFVVKGGNALAWSARGFDDGPGNQAIKGLSSSLDHDTVLKTAISSSQTFLGSPDTQRENDALLGRLGGPRPSRLLAVPLMVRKKAAAVLYADSSDRGDGSINIEAIELLVLSAGLVVELVSLRTRLGDSVQTRPSGPVVTATSGSLAATPAAGGSGGLATPAIRPDQSAAASPPTPAEVVAPGPIGGMTEDEEKQHNDARRFARLLVSEIKLYNEQKVSEGRRNGDLYERLKEDIERSRAMYDKRVARNVADKVDYFYDELVSTLAEGDASKLGSRHPGPSAPS